MGQHQRFTRRRIVRLQDLQRQKWIECLRPLYEWCRIRWALILQPQPGQQRVGFERIGQHRQHLECRFAGFDLVVIGQVGTGQQQQQISPLRFLAENRFQFGGCLFVKLPLKIRARQSTTSHLDTVRRGAITPGVQSAQFVLEYLAVRILLKSPFQVPGSRLNGVGFLINLEHGRVGDHVVRYSTQNALENIGGFLIAGFVEQCAAQQPVNRHVLGKGLQNIRAVADHFFERFSFDQHLQLV